MTDKMENISRRKNYELNYIDCDKNRNECSIAGITGYPTWNINEQNYPGEQSIERLAQLSGYQEDNNKSEN